MIGLEWIQLRVGMEDVFYSHYMIESVGPCDVSIVFRPKDLWMDGWKREG